MTHTLVSVKRCDGLATSLRFRLCRLFLLVKHVPTSLHRYNSSSCLTALIGLFWRDWQKSLPVNCQLPISCQFFFPDYTCENERNASVTKKLDSFCFVFGWSLQVKEWVKKNQTTFFFFFFIISEKDLDFFYWLEEFFSPFNSSNYPVISSSFH